MFEKSIGIIIAALFIAIPVLFIFFVLPPEAVKYLTLVILIFNLGKTYNVQKN